jgi:hypothetical protein
MPVPAGGSGPGSPIPAASGRAAASSPTRDVPCRTAQRYVERLEELSDLASLEAAAGEPVRPYDEFLTELGAAEGDGS